MAELEITYTPQYTGCHRICLTYGETTCCYLDYSLTIVGVEKTVIIPLSEYDCVTPPGEIGCEGYTLNGYIQPCCTEESSELNRVAFTATWTITPCVQYELQCRLIGGQCLPWTFTDCTGAFTGPEEGIWGGPGTVPAIICSSAGPPNTTGGNYDVVEITPGTCCSCRSYTVTAEVPFIILIYYTDCTGAFINEPLSVAPGAPVTICAIENTIWTVTENAFFTALDNGPCVT